MDDSASEYKLKPVGTSNDTDKEEERLIHNQELSVSEKRARVAAVVLAVVTIFIVGTLAIVTMVIAIKYECLSAIVFAADGLLDSLDSIVVIWRFYDPQQTWSPHREYIGCVALGVFSFISAIGLFVNATLSITDPSNRINAVDDIWIISSVDAVACLILASLKFYVSHVLRSLVVFTDAVNSAIGAIMAITAVVSSLIIEQHQQAWLLDPIVAYVFTVFFALYGVWLFVPSKYPITGGK